MALPLRRRRRHTGRKTQSGRRTLGRIQCPWAGCGAARQPGFQFAFQAFSPTRESYFVTAPGLQLQNIEGIVKTQSVLFAASFDEFGVVFF